MEHIPSSKAGSHSASQEIPRLLCNPQVHNRVHKSPPLVPEPDATSGHLPRYEPRKSHIQGVLITTLCTSINVSVK